MDCTVVACSNFVYLILEHFSSYVSKTGTLWAQYLNGWINKVTKDQSKSECSRRSDFTVLWAHFESWHHIRRCTRLAGKYSLWVHICETKYRQLVTTCTYAYLSRKKWIKGLPLPHLLYFGSMQFSLFSHLSFVHLEPFSCFETNTILLLSKILRPV